MENATVLTLRDKASPGYDKWYGNADRLLQCECSDIATTPTRKCSASAVEPSRGPSGSLAMSLGRSAMEATLCTKPLSTSAPM